MKVETSLFLFTQDNLHYPPFFVNIKRNITESQTNFWNKRILLRSECLNSEGMIGDTRLCTRRTGGGPSELCAKVLSRLTDYAGTIVSDRL